MIFTEEELKDVITKREINDILSFLNNDIINTNVKEQIRMVKNFDMLKPVDYIQVFDTKYSVLYNKYSNLEEVILNLEKSREDFYKNILNSLQENLSFKIDFNYSLGKDEIYNCINQLYNFFVLDFQENLVEGIFSYIIENQKTLIKKFKKTTNKKDLFFKTLKKEFNLDRTLILYNLNLIIEGFKEFHAEDIINLLINDESEVSNIYIKQLFFNDISDVTYGINFSKNIINSVYYNVLKINLRGKLIEYYKNEGGTL